MFDDFCRWLYWTIWAKLPSEEELMAKLSPEDRARFEELRHLLGMRHG